MSDADDTTDELEAIRQQKREKLEQLLEDGVSIEDALAGEDSEESAEDAPATPTEPIHVDGPDHFRDVIASHDLVFVDFYADWCGPCQMLEPIVEELAAESPAAVAKVDSDVHQGLTQQYGVQGLPTMLLVQQGEPVERLMGFKQKEELSGVIERYA